MLLPEVARHVCVALAALTLGLGSSGCAREPKPPLERGAGVFQRSCASCHGVGREQKVALGFKVTPPDLADAALQARVSDAEFRRVIREGKGQMPPFGKMLADEEVSDLLVYLRSLARSNPQER
ncbi:MAG TPA: cytochrome c [Polyangiaceae bacterium]|nr:cytochrome c [Polyangiaceae bacterium]